MSGMKVAATTWLFILLTPIIFSFSFSTHAQTTLVREAGEAVVQGLRRLMGREETASLLAVVGGPEVVQRVAERTLREGGEDALATLTRYTANHGSDMLRAADNAVNIPTMMRALEDLPDEMAARAIRRLSTGSQGRELAIIVESHGARALRGEVAHPGIGGRLVADLGEEGGDLIPSLTTQQARQLSGYGSSIRILPEEQKASVVQLLREYPDRFFSFVGDFTQRNPGTTLFTVAGTTILLANSESVFGGEGEMVVGEDGVLRYVAKPGLLERVIISQLNPFFSVLLMIMAIGVSALITMRLWFHYKKRKLMHEVYARKTNSADDNLSG